MDSYGAEARCIKLSIQRNFQHETFTPVKAAILTCDISSYAQHQVFLPLTTVLFCGALCFTLGEFFCDRGGTVVAKLQQQGKNTVDFRPTLIQ